MITAKSYRVRQTSSVRVRLNKYLARCGVTSRRKADTYITQGRVAVNEKIITEKGTRIDPARDVVTVDGQRTTLPDSHVYYLLHKPENVLSTVDDPHDRTTVVDLIRTKRRIYPVGRLDFDTTGVLLLTDDGQLTYRLTHPSHKVPRTYQVWYTGKLPVNAVKQLNQGIGIGEDLPARGELRIASQQEESGMAYLTLHAGRYHEVKRIFEHFHCEVERLHRTAFAGLTCDRLAPGQYRELKPDEVKQLKAGG